MGAAAGAMYDASASCLRRCRRRVISMRGVVALDRSSVPLTEFEMEELRMVSRFSYAEIAMLYDKYRKADTLSEGKISREQFQDIPEISMNPFRERLAATCRFDEAGNMSFKDFVMSLSVFSPYGTRERKLKAAFALYDDDGDGRISKEDLFATLKRITLFPPAFNSDELLRDIVRHTMEEAAGDEDSSFLSLADFSKVVLVHNTEFERKLNIDLFSSYAYS